MIAVANDATWQTKEEAQFLADIETQLGVVADISRADILLYGPLVSGKTRVMKHVHPHSVAPAHLKNYSGAEVTRRQMPVVVKALQSGRRRSGSQGMFGDGARVFIEARPIFAPGGAKRVIGAISIATSLFERERLRRRSRVFQKTLRQLQAMLTGGRLKNTEVLSPFGEHEGLIMVDRAGYIRYASGIATNLYRKLGYVDDLENRQLDSLETHDDKLARQAMTTLACVEREDRDGGHDWMRKAIPILSKPTLKSRLWYMFKKLERPEELDGVLIVLRDITEERRQEKEIRVKNAMIQEIHHRVKNNLQTIAALLRIQARRISGKEAETALKDAINRILSVAVIHEFLSDHEAWAINMKEVSQRIITQLQQGIISPEVKIDFSLQGPSIWLPARQATACALVINELLQNAVEHGFGQRAQGSVAMTLNDEGDHVVITINDDGRGLPADFNLSASTSLGLQIARTLVTEDLQGALNLVDQDNGGTMAKISFPKAFFGGEEGWTANEYS